MPLADYAHWNEDAERIWWEEEGKHVEEPPWEDPEFYNDTMGPADAFAEELGEVDDVTLVDMYLDKADLLKWPQKKPLIEWELQYRGIAVR